MDFETDLTVTFRTSPSSTDRMMVLMAVKEIGAGWVPHIMPDRIIPVASTTIKAGDHECKLEVDKSMKYLLQIVDLPSANYEQQCNAMFGEPHSSGQEQS